MSIWIEKGKEWLKAHEYKIVVAMALVIVAVLSFELGLLRGAKWQVEPVVIEKPAETSQSVTCPDASQNASGASNLTMVKGITQAGVPDQSKNCTFVGSKNSTKVHVPTCTFAKRIKPENQVCFASVEEAISKGRTADKCIK